MEQENYPHILSDREQKEWIPDCPVQVKRVRLSIPEKDGGIVLSAVITPCGGFDISAVTARAVLTDARHKTTAAIEHVIFIPGDSVGRFDGEIPAGSVYGYVTVQSVSFADGTVWNNAEDTKGTVLPAQKVIWQTDPHYEAIRYVCKGVVEAKYYPDEPAAGAWRCACGQVNLADGNDVCGRCSCTRNWLSEAFSEAYLTEAARLMAENKPTVVKKPKVKQGGISDKTKFILILAAAALVIGGLISAPFIGKSIRYSRAERYLEQGEYDLAIDAFTKLEGYSDSEVKVQEAYLGRAKEQTGLEALNMVWSRRMKCYSITSDGVLSFRPDDYTGDWTNFVIPDVVDGIVVRELDENFFMNCKSLQSVTISDCVEVLGEGTFFNCEALTTIHFGKNVRELGVRCFINCTALTELTIPDSVEKIGLRAFNNCVALKNVTLGSGITTIPAYLFSNCLSLKTVTATVPVTSVAESAFAECAAFRTFVYPGTEAMWAEVAISEEGNHALLGAEIDFAE